MPHNRPASVVLRLGMLPFAAFALASRATAAPTENPSLYEKVKAAAVEILHDGHLQGSGSIVDAKGLVLTAAHVIERPEHRFEVSSPTLGRLDAKLVAVDLGHDLALLRIDPRKDDYPALRLASKAPSPGTEVYIFGTPMYRHGVFERGMVARSDPTFEYYVDRYNEVTHIAATVQVGMSGGPWFDSEGDVFGVQSAVMSQTSIPVGISYSSPLESIRTLVRRQQSAATPTLEAIVEEIWQQDRKTLDRFPPKAEGVLVKEVRENGPSARAGLKVSDLIVAADGRKVRLADDLMHAVRDKKPGEPIELNVLVPDGAGSRKVVVTLGKLEVGWP